MCASVCVRANRTSPYQQQRKATKQARREAHLHAQHQPKLSLQAAGAEVYAVAQALSGPQLMERGLCGHLGKQFSHNSSGDVVGPQLWAHMQCVGRVDRAGRT
jgi:hypothetical protein